ncbi:unnamed protein product [Rotaria magnacalcarata]|uniref:Uncharacterized protein n=1 Tax=Rotaria magnacalcarata TaxID=392030 RepID=A0A816TRD1_9BILA|nr:unnamed protein product [Rotaria magnacalcarata]CAF2101097.1 unnamed protein product [Rotaria magnacalcarata]CAF3831475.1 unnamed protein product [Rotaria magnacalcarata]CAF4049301.1 unnamed protein product [Rotaria magnacalcarata]CAF4345297.1 unnamed protein product [Rotaria magnacalcarata]
MSISSEGKSFHDGIYQIFCSQHHEHESLENSIVSVEIRSVIRDLALNGLSVGQIQKNDGGVTSCYFVALALMSFFELIFLHFLTN